MDSGTEIYRFGPFELDSGRRCLSRDGQPVALSPRLMDILLLLVSHAGQIVPKEAVIKAGWGDMVVTDDSVAQAIKLLRNVLGIQQDGAPHIETVNRRGFRFLATLDQSPQGEPDSVLEAKVAPYRALVEGRAALETLELDALPLAHAAFDEMLRADRQSAAAHIGMANVFFMRHESTRADVTPEAAALQKAEYHAREGRRLNSASGSAWTTLGVVESRLGDGRQAIATVCKGISLEQKLWPHYVRLAEVSWGEECVLAADRASKLCPGISLPYWHTAKLFAARQAFGPASDELRTGCALQDALRDQTGRSGGAGLRLLLGFVRDAQGDDDGALEELARERSFGERGHIYSREACANACYGIGAIHLRRRRVAEATSAFQQALLLVPGHPMAAIGLAVALGLPFPQPNGRHAHPVHAAIAVAAALGALGRHHDGARVCRDPLLQAGPGSIGWQIAIDPLINANAHLDAWAEVLAILRDRAT